MTVTSSPTERTPTRSEGLSEPAIEQLIGHSLARVEEFSDEEVDRQLAQLIICATRVKLPDYVKTDTVDELIDAVPVAAELIEKIHVTADHILAEETFEGEAAVLIVRDLGIAADVTQDKELLEKTIDALEDTHDYHMESLKRALKIAHDEEQLFGDVYRNMKAGQPVVATSVQQPVVMSQRPDFAADSGLALLSRYDRPLGNTKPRSVTMDSYADLYAGYRPHRHDVDERVFEVTPAHIKEILGQIAAEESLR